MTALPRGNERFSPRGNEQFSPRGNDRFSPIGNDRFSPRGNDRFSPRGSERYSPKSNERTSRFSVSSILGVTRRISLSSKMPSAGLVRSQLFQLGKNFHEFLESLHYEPQTAFKTPSKSAPWLDESGSRWSRRRICVAKVVESKCFEFALMIIILFNVGLIIFETDQEAKCYPEFHGEFDACPTSHKNIAWLKIANDVLLVTYTFEAMVTMYALRCIYVRSPTHMLDLMLCAGGWLPYLGVDVVSVVWLRVFRICRILKAAKLKNMANRVPELDMLLSGFKGSMKAMFFGTLILATLLCFFSIFTVQFVHPTNSQIRYPDCDRCARGFQSIADSMLTLYQQIVAGDSWGAISIPVVEHSYVGLLLPFIQLVVSLGAMNLVLGVVVDQAMEAHESNRIANAERNAEARKLRKMQLLDTVRSIDCDHSGDIDRDEIDKAVRTNVELQTRLALAGLRLDELEEIVQALTSTGNGNSISYESVCNIFDDIEAADIRKAVVMTKLLLSSMHRDMNGRFDQQEKTLATISRRMDRVSKTHEINEKNRAGSEVQERTDKPVPCSLPGHRSRPVSISTNDFDSRLGELITDAIMSCEAAIGSENKSVQQSLMQMDAKLSVSLRALEETLQSWADSSESSGFNARFLEHAMGAHQTLERRRHNLCQNFVNALEDDLSLWESFYSILGAADSAHAKYERDHHAERASASHTVHKDAGLRVAVLATDSKLV